MLKFEVVLVGGGVETFYANCERDVWVEYGDEAVSVSCGGYNDTRSERGMICGEFVADYS